MGCKILGRDVSLWEGKADGWGRLSSWETPGVEEEGWDGRKARSKLALGGALPSRMDAGGQRPRG